LKVHRAIGTGLAVLLMASTAMVVACAGGGGGGGSSVPPPSTATYETPPIEECLSPGETVEKGGIKFAFTEYVVMDKIRDYAPLESGNQYLLMHYKVENTTSELLDPPYLDTTITVIYQGRPLAIPSLIFKPDVPLPDGRSARLYYFQTMFSGKLEGGKIEEGWQCYLIPTGFNPSETFLRVKFDEGDVFWNLGK